MAVKANKIELPAITDATYDLLCGELRRRFGITLHGWAIDQGHAPSTVYAAVHGRRGGDDSLAILGQLEEKLNAKDE